MGNERVSSGRFVIVLVVVLVLGVGGAEVIAPAERVHGVNLVDGVDLVDRLSRRLSLLKTLPICPFPVRGGFGSSFD
jgi:hypothetical protein